MRGWCGWAVVTSMLVACATRKPVAPLGHVSASHAIRVRFAPEPQAIRMDFRGQPYPSSKVESLFGDAEDAIERFNRVFVNTLRRAGYEVTENGPSDVVVVRQLQFETEARQARHGNTSVGLDDIARVVLHVYDTNGNAIDRFEFGAMDGTECVVVDVVNAMLRSPKVASYTQTRKKSEPVDD